VILYRHHRDVVVLPRVIVAALIAVLSVGPVALCAGWQATSEARMACCVEGMACSMHTSEDESTGTRTVSQAEADSCCAAGEPDDASPTAPSLAAMTAMASNAAPILLPPPPPISRAVSLNDPAPARDHGVSRHLLLSVFII
jgi:hypothetical protein